MTSWPSWLDPGTRPVLVVHAHPDDEVFATAAAAAWLSTGADIVLRVATGGEAGEMSMTPDIDVVTARDRRWLRLQRSCARLGVADVDWLGRPAQWVDDGGTSGSTSVASASAEVTTAVADVLAGLRPQLVLTVGSDGLTGHPDHVAVHQAVIAAVRAADLPGIEVLGARARAADVQAAQRSLQPLVRGPVGSGRIVGSDSEVLRLAAPASVALARRDALAEYSDILAHEELAAAAHAYRSHSDSLLMRALFDVTGWNVEHYERVTIRTG